MYASIALFINKKNFQVLSRHPVTTSTDSYSDVLLKYLLCIIIIAPLSEVPLLFYKFYATEAHHIYLTYSDTFSQYPCIKACLEDGGGGGGNKI